MEEESCSFGDDFPGLGPLGFQAVAYGVEGEGEQVQGGEGFGQMLFSVAEVVFQTVAVVFERVEAFIFDLPPGSGAGCDLGDRLGRDGLAGGECAVAGRLSGCVGDRDAYPVDLERVPAVA